MSPSSASLKFPQSGFCKMKSDSAVAARGLISRRRRKWRCVPCSTRRATTKCTRSLFKSSRHLERSRRIPVRNLKGNFHGIPRLPLGMTDSADNLEQFFRLRILVFGVAIELQIVETAIVAGFGQQLCVGANFFQLTAVHHYDLIRRQNGGKPMGNRYHGLAGGEPLQSHLNLFFRFGIERGSGFVE